MTKKTDRFLLRHLNRSKKRDPRFWREGRALGLVADINLTHGQRENGSVVHIRAREGRTVTAADVSDYADRHHIRLATAEDLYSPPSDTDLTQPDTFVVDIPLFRFERGQLELGFERSWKPGDRFLAVPHFGE